MAIRIGYVSRFAPEDRYAPSRTNYDVDYLKKQV